MAIPNFGRKSLDEAKEFLKSLGLELGIRIPDWQTPPLQELVKKLLHEQSHNQVSLPPFLTLDNATLIRPMDKLQETEEFESITEGLTVRAKHVLTKLGVKDTAALQQLTSNDLMRAWSCGKKTLAEIEALQSKLWPPKEEEVSQSSTAIFQFDDVPKEVFEAVLGALSVRGIHTLKDLGVNCLKAFMLLKRGQLLECRECGRKTTDEILQIQDGISEFVCDSVNKSSAFKPEQLLSAPCLVGFKTGQTNVTDSEVVFIDIENPAAWLTGWIRSLSRSKNQAQAFMLRKGMLGNHPITLELVGEQVGGVTRERVRQMERYVEKRASAALQQQRLRPLIDAAVAVVKQNGMIELDELTKVLLCRGEDGDKLSFATELISFFSTLEVWKHSGLMLQKDGIIRSGDSLPLIHRLASVIEEVASSAADERISSDLWSINRGRLKTALMECSAATAVIPKLEDVSDSLLDALIKQSRDRIKARKDRIYSTDLWRLRFGKVMQMLDTVLRQIGKPAHFSEITKRATAWRPNLSERNVHATLDRVGNALLWDRGTFVHKDSVIIPHSLIHDVELWLLEVLKEDVPLVSIYGAFMHFHTRCEKAGFPSEVALYTCLRESAHHELEYPRLPRIYLKKRFVENIPMVVIFENFLRDAGGPVSQQEAREFIVGKIFLKDFQFYQLTQQVPNVIRTADWGYLHLDNSDLSLESLQPLLQYTQQILSKEEHCSVDKIFHSETPRPQGGAS
jgi:hypothetical protein